MFAMVAMPAILGYSIQYSMAGLVLSSAFRLIWLLVILFRHSNPSFDGQFILANLKSATPLVLSMFLSGSAQYIDSFIITYYFDDATFAVFRYGAREFPLVLLLANAFSSSMLPGFVDRSKLKLNLEKIRQNSLELGSWLFPLSGLLMIFSHWAFPVIFNSSFSGSATIFNIYLLLIVSRLLFPQTILIGLQKTRPIMWTSALEIAIHLALSLWFVQYWGIAGVAFGTVCSYLFEKLVLIAIVRKTYGLRINEYLNLKRHVHYSILLSGLFIVIEYLIY